MIWQVLYGLLIAIFVVLQEPSLILRSQWITLISERKGVHWSGLQIHSKSLGVLKSEIDLNWQSVLALQPEFRAQSAQGNVRIIFNFLHPSHFLDQVKLLTVRKMMFSSTSVSGTSPVSSGPGFGSRVWIPAWLRRAEFGIMDIQISQWSSGKEHGEAYVRHAPAAQGGEWIWSLGGIEVSHHFKGALTVVSENRSLTGPWRLSVDAEARHLSPELRRIQTRNCVIHWATQGASSGKGIEKDALNLICPIEVTVRPPTIQTLPHLRFHERIKLVLSSKLESSNILNMNAPITVEGRALLDEVRATGDAAHLGKILGEIRASGRVTPSEPMKKWKLKSDFDFEVEFSNFQRLVRFLDPTIYAVPAPFHALEGMMRLQAQGRLQAAFGKMPFQFSTRLHSPNQSLDLDGEGAVLIQKNPNLDFILVLSDVQIPLPHFDLAAPPQFLPDPRIQKKPSELAGRKPSPLVYRLFLKTGDRPMRIQTNLAKTPMPIRVNLTMDSKGAIKGTIFVESFPLDLFRRNAEVEYFTVGLGEREKKITGSFKVTYTDYTIHIRVLGTVDQPDFKFVSDPPLSDSDVIAVLLFGRTSQALDPTQTQSVGNVRSAVAARGLDLASLYLLTATPVESIGWDPQSETFSAKFRLAEGTSLSVTKGQEEMESIGIRKRIGGHWAITTQLGNPVDPTDHSIFALLEWSHRY